MAETARNEHLLGEAELLDWLGYTQRSQLRRRLDGMGCPYITGRDGQIATTLEAVNAALRAEDDETVRFL